MAKNSKQSSKKIATLASEVLKDNSSSKIAKELAGSVLSQTGTTKQTGAELETKASKVLHSDKYSQETKTLAGSVLSQANKERS
ncbi:MAG: hypothetical protein KC422_04860 [Trueperaceae bacterium]|nr:hypothetical protein [Trueperaceae bacterium]